MAISKQQPMRPALTDVVDVIGDGFSSDLTITQSLSATNRAITSIEGDIDELQRDTTTIDNGLDALEQAIGDYSLLDDTVANSIVELAANAESLSAFADRFKIGCINNVTIPANDSVSTSATFDEPFGENDACVLFAQVVTNELASLFTYTLIDCTYSGFSYSIANSDADEHTVSLGYVAIKVN